MESDEELLRSGLSRRGFFAGIVAAGVATGTATAHAAVTDTGGKPDPSEVPLVSGLHLQFGADAATEMVVSWHSLQPVQRPRVLLGRHDTGYEHSVSARTVSYTDDKSGQVVYAHHADLRGLSSDTEYIYAAVHAGAEPEFSGFRTGPAGRARFTFTSFGDQGTPTLGKRYTPPSGVVIPFPPYVNDNLGAPAGADVTSGVERVRPLFHLFNGDLCYANLATDRVRTWWDFWDNNSRSARHRPWMPAAGNHESEHGNGPLGFAAYQTYFALPGTPGQTEVTRGLWYSFTVGSVRVISISNDDVCYQDGADYYLRGYSQGAQRAWLIRELAASRSDPGIDWVVVCMHQVAISTAARANGADLGIRQEWLPLFDAYGVDLVVCGHEHHYERSLPIRDRETNATLSPIPATTRSDVIDTTKGTVHMILGGGGSSATSNQLLSDPPRCEVITSVGPPDPSTGKRPSVYVTEDAAWASVRDAAHSYGFAEFTVDPGDRPGGWTSIEVKYYDVVGSGGQLKVFDSFTLRRPRRDA